MRCIKMNIMVMKEQLLEFFEDFYPVLQLRRGCDISDDNWYWYDSYIRDNFYDDSFAKKLCLMCRDNSLEYALDNDAMNKIIEASYAYLSNSLEYKSFTYNKSFFCKLFSSLDFLNINYKTFDLLEMERVMKLLKEKRKVLNVHDDIERVLEELNNWSKTYYIESWGGGLFINEPYYEITFLLNNVISMFADMMEHKYNSCSIDNFMKEVEKLKLEISRIKVEIRKPENYRWKLDKDLNLRKSEFLPHNFALMFLDNFIFKNIDFAKEIVDNTYEDIFDWYDNKEFISDLGYGKDVTIFEFYDSLIENLSKLIEQLKKNDKISEADNNLYFSLFNYFVNCFNEKLVNNHSSKGYSLRKKK